MSVGCAGEIENPEDFREALAAATTPDGGSDEPSKAGAGASGRGAGMAGATSVRPDAAAAGGGGDPDDDAGTPLAGSGGAGAPAAAGGGGAGSGAGGRGGAGASAGAGAAASGGGGGAAAGAGAAGGGGNSPPPQPSCDFRGLVMMKCAGASCHGGPTASTGLDLTSPSLAMRVQGRTASGACSDKLLVDKDNPAESALYQRVTGSDCGVRMPLGGTLTPAEQACFLSWIEGL